MNQTQLDFSISETLAVIGMTRARDKADIDLSKNDKNGLWSNDVYNLLLEYIENVNEFMTEQFREWTFDKIEQPANARSYGSIIRLAAKNKIIKLIGYRRVKNINAHSTPAALWRKN